jgi:large subunit ribosomal protein L17
MRHQRTGKKLGRDSAHRKALYANLTGALIEHGRIKTTVTKAKAVKPIAERMITLGRRGDLHARRQAVAFLRSKDVVHKLFAEVAPRMGERPGGYSRIVKLGPRSGDAAEMVYLELVDDPVVLRPRAQQAVATGPALEESEAVDEEVLEPEAEAEIAAGDEDDEHEAAETEPQAGEEPPEEPDATAGPTPEAESGEEQTRS